MLPAQARLRRSADFAAAVRRSSTRVGRRTLVAHLHQRSEDGPAARAQAGFIVSRAVGGAVVRNRVKRRLRHLVADRLDRLPAGSVLVVRALPAAAGAAGAQLAADLDSALAAADRDSRRRRVSATAP